MQHYKLGQYFRKRYSPLIGNGEYLSDIIYVQSKQWFFSDVSFLNLVSFFNAFLKARTLIGLLCQQSQIFVGFSRQTANNYGTKIFHGNPFQFTQFHKFWTPYWLQKSHARDIIEKLENTKDLLNFGELLISIDTYSNICLHILESLSTQYWMHWRSIIHFGSKI